MTLGAVILITDRLHESPIRARLVTVCAIERAVFQDDVRLQVALVVEEDPRRVLGAWLLVAKGRMSLGKRREHHGFMRRGPRSEIPAHAVPKRVADEAAGRRRISAAGNPFEILIQAIAVPMAGLAGIRGNGLHAVGSLVF